MAAQLILIKGPFFLSLALWMAVANTSLPVPLSPVKRIGVGVLQIRDKIFFYSIILSEIPIIDSKISGA